MITDELREWARDNTAQGVTLTTYPVQHPVHGTLESLLAIADRIDAEHERACREQFACGAEHGIGASIESAEYQAHGWAKLPVDADGVPIRVGDKINVYQTKNLEVVGVGDGTVFTHYYMGDYHKHYAGDCHVVKQPTVEDMLEQFLTAYDDAEEGQLGITTRDVIAEYAAKLRLAGEGE